jgi:CNT family concentrative nucleoside transporter
MEDSTYRLILLSGFFVLSSIAWVSGTRTKIKTETIVGSISLTWVLGALTLCFSGSRTALEWINDFLIALLSASQKGSIFLFGPLALSPGKTLADGTSSIGFVLSFQIFLSVIFFSALVGGLYNLGIM